MKTTYFQSSDTGEYGQLMSVILLLLRTTYLKVDEKTVQSDFADTWLDIFCVHSILMPDA